MARNRKRAKERRARRPQPVAAARGKHEEDAPDPMSHAAPDVELAEAQMALGRPGVEELDSEPESRPDVEEAEVEEAEEFEAPRELDGERSTEVTVPAAAAAEQRAVHGNRLINFLQGSWRELQRVQWPDRRQVIQATGVVIGFVIVAGVFLGVADFLAGKLMNFVLK